MLPDGSVNAGPAAKKAAGITGSLPAKTVQPFQRPSARRSAPPARRPTAAGYGRHSTGCSAGPPGPARSNSKPTARPPPATVSPDSPTYPAPPAHRQRLPAAVTLERHTVSPAGAQRKRSRRSLDRCDTMKRPAAGRFSGQTSPFPFRLFHRSRLL